MTCPRCGHRTWGADHEQLGCPPHPDRCVWPLPALLEGWANQVAGRFNAPVWLVGSALTGDPWARDVDIRVVLSDEAFEQRYGCAYAWVHALGHDVSSPEAIRYHRDMAKHGAWASVHHSKGLNIDFQVQAESHVARQYADKPRVRLDKLGELPVPATEAG